MTNGKSYKSIWIFIPLILLVYWQISFFTASLKWDLLDVVFPFRYHFSSALMSGYFPLWNPYIQTGVPFYADLQAPTYYPELILISSLGGYSIFWMHFLVATYLILGFIGFYRMLKFFEYSDWVAAVSAFIYVCSGYFVGHGQHFFLLVGAAWIPWVIWSYLNFLDNQNRKTALTFLLTTFLMLTGGYQALSICLFYLLLIFFLVKVYRLIQGNYKDLYKLLLWHLVVVAVLLILLSPLFFAVIEISSQVSRLSEGVRWNDTAKYGENFRSLISFLAPLSTAQKNTFFGHIDQSMLNHFVGVCGLFFGIYGWKSKRINREWILLIFGLIIGSMSFTDLPIRKIMFEHVPLMNLFLQGPYVRIFMILGIIVFIAGGFEKWHKHQIISPKEFVLPFFIIFMLLAFTAIFWASFDFSKFNIFWLNSSNWLDGWKKIDFLNLLGFQLILSSLFLCVLVLVLILSKKLKYPKFWITAVVFIELFLASQWNQSETYVDRNYNPSYLHKNIELAPTGFPIPHLTPIGFNDDQHAFSLPFWRNTSIFQKEISFHAFSSFELNNYSYIDDKDALLRDWILKNSMVYFSDSVIQFSELKTALLSNKIKQNAVFLELSEFNKLSKINFKSDSTDEIKITGFSPNVFRIATQTKNQQLLILQQSFQPEWKAYIDGKSTEIIRVNKNYQAIILPSGSHIIEFKFEKNSTIVLYLISQFLFWFLFIYLIYLSLNEERKSKWYVKMLFFLPVIFISFWALKFYNGRLNNLNTSQQVLLDWKNKSTVKKVVLSDSIELSHKDEFCNFGKWKLKELKNASTLRMITNCKMDSIKPTLLVYQVIRKGESVKWEAFKIERQLEKKGKFNQVFFMRNLSDLKDDDEIVLYCWNLSKSHIKFKNGEVDFLK